MLVAYYHGKLAACRTGYRKESIMRFATLNLCILSFVGVGIFAQSLPSRGPSQSAPISKHIVIAASAVLDGKGRVLHNLRIVIDGSKIVAVLTKVDPKDAAVD